jgi:hypothetical protein
MGRVNSQKENGLKERENGFRPGNGGQQPKTEKSFISGTLGKRPLPERRLQSLVVGGGRGTVVKPSSVIGLRGSRAPSWHRLRGWSSGRGHSSVRGRRTWPPQVGVRPGPGASISEAARSPIEQARPVTAEGLSMSPLPCVPAGRFRRSGTRGSVEAVRRLWSSGDPRCRSDRRGPAAGGSGVKAGAAPGAAGPGLDARASSCAIAIIGSMPRSDLLRPRRLLAHPARAASESRCRPATSGA